MSEKNTSQSTNDNPITDFLDDLRDELRSLWQTLRDGWDMLGIQLRNQMRLARKAHVDYVIVQVGGTLPERAEPPRSFIQRQLPLPAPALSMEVLTDILQHIADADNVKGVVFIFGGFATGTATLQSFRSAVARLRAAGKDTVVYTPYLDVAHYYAATSANRIVVPPSASFSVLGLRSEITFLKDALETIGVEAEVVQISPYKSAFDQFHRTDMSEAMRDQFNWLLDERYDMLTAAMAEGRQMSQETMQALIDRAPFSVEEALEIGLVDIVGFEDELPWLLADEEETPAEADATPDTADIPESEEADTAVTTTNSSGTSDEIDNKKERPKANLLHFPKAYPLLLEKGRRHSQKHIGVISLEGIITLGESTSPPIDLPIPFLGGVTAGHETLLRTLRRAEQDNQLAALVFHVDSGGGLALAADLITRDVQRLAQKIPVVVYMSNVAGSGGYLVSAFAHHIICQPLTITGSIGVVTMHIDTTTLFTKLRLNRQHLQRGQNARLYDDSQPLTPENRQILWDSIQESYRKFKEAVANGRNLPFDELDPICEGRVWTGRQAKEHDLVDSHGDLQDAVRLAAELADLPMDDDHTVPVVNLHHRDGGYRPPQPYDALEAVGKLLAGDRLRQLTQRPLLLMPFDFRHLD